GHRRASILGRAVAELAAVARAPAGDRAPRAERARVVQARGQRDAVVDARDFHGLVAVPLARPVAELAVVVDPPADDVPARLQGACVAPAFDEVEHLAEVLAREGAHLPTPADASLPEARGIPARHRPLGIERA